MKSIVWFAEVGKDDIPLVGGKGANLGEMTRAGLPVPPGFIVTADAYYAFLDNTKLDKKIKDVLCNINPEDSKTLNALSKELETAILESPMPKNLSEQIKSSYDKLSSKEDVFVAVRSSATAEDLPDASFAGQQETFLNIKGGSNVVKAVQKAWASLFEPRAIYYRTINHFDHLKVGIAIPVQIMVESVASGVMFAADPVSGDTGKIVIDAGLGLGEAIVLGSIDPDHYVLSKEPLQIVSKEIKKQTWKIVRDPKGGDKHVTVKHDEQETQKITDEQILVLGGLAKKNEAHYGHPNDMEWAIDKDEKVFLVQSRPITTLKKESPATQNSATSVPTEQSPTGVAPTPQASGEVILKGAAASMGIASGPVKIIHKPTEIDQVLPGDVLVTEMTNPEYVPAMRRVAAIVTDTGGRTSHAAIVSRELGIPCVVGSGTATSTLKMGQMITVDGAKGLVYKGKVTIPTGVASSPGTQSNSPTPGSYEPTPIITGTKVYVNLGEPHLAEKVAAQPVDGVGLLRAEFIIAGMGEHPRAMMKDGRSKEFVDKLAEGMQTICQAFYPRPVVYRATDFKTNEYRDLKGGAEFEPQEANPMIGYRGAFRYVKEPDLFKLELEALKKVRAGDLTNLWLMIPFVRSIAEFIAVRQIVTDSGLKQDHDFKLWIMCEVPSTVILIDKFCDLGIDGVSIGSNDLTQLTLGCDRDNPALATEFDERDEAVELSLKHVITTCRKRNVTVSICGQAPSVYPEITELMVKSGATSVSVTPDMIVSTRKVIASVERRLLLNQMVS
ncbi:MAG: phosphoenolpyruvate synthase [bacterium]|nr:phosphoenolpyruvate synthase [bacterium]